MSLHKICLLGYGKLTELGVTAIRRLNYSDTEIKIVECNVDNLLEEVSTSMQEGFEVFVGGFGNAAEFMRTIGKNLIEIRVDYPDYLYAIEKALKLGQHPAVTFYRHASVPDFTPVEKLTGVSIGRLAYEDGSELSELIAESSCDVIIGASHACEMAQAHGRQSVLLYPGVESIMQALQRARDFAIDQETGRSQRAIIRALLNNSSFGLIVSDTEDRITLFNEAAQRMTGIAAHEARSRRMSELFPALQTNRFMKGPEEQTDGYHRINQILFRCVQNKVRSTHHLIGVLTTLNFDTRSRRQNENRVRSLPSAASMNFEALPIASAAGKKLLQEARDYSQTNLPLIVSGPEGSAKRILAQCIHNASSFQNGPYLRINLSSLGSFDAGRWLCGHEEHGMRHSGLFSQAEYGTLVLEGLENASPQAFSILLDTLSSGSFQPLGSGVSVPAQFRTISILNAQALERLSPAVLNRLGPLRLELPPLSDLKEDIPAIFFSLISARSDQKFKERILTPKLKRLLMEYSWPGNLAELEACAERFLFHLSSLDRTNELTCYRALLSAVGEDAFFADFTARYPAIKSVRSSVPSDLSAFRSAASAVKELLNYNNDQLAEKLGVSRTTLWRYLKTGASE